MYSSSLPIYNLPVLKKGEYVSRPNRFTAEIIYNDKIELAHIHDPGRLEELLIKGTEILFDDSKGKLKYYIKAIKTDNEWVLIDTAQHSKIALNIFRYIPELSKFKEIRKEVPIGKSRIDFVVDGIPLEVKGVTLVKNGVALFPDAPTERGARHIEEIIQHKGIILFLIFRRANKFAPNPEIDPNFSNKLSNARKKGILIIPVQISFDGLMLFYQGKIELANF
jgi:sugar fermentation stimulation protein A